MDLRVQLIHDHEEGESIAALSEIYGVARKTMLDLGSADGKAVEIVAGATLGERIIVSDIKRYQDLDSIRISN